MTTYYRNLPRHLTAQQEAQIDAIVAAERPHHGIGTQRWAEESPCIWAEHISPETIAKLDSALVRMGLRHE